MKKIFILICLLVTLPLSACFNGNLGAIDGDNSSVITPNIPNEDTQLPLVPIQPSTPTPLPSPPNQQLPEGDIETDEDNEDIDEEENQKRKKKLYAVSSVNSLRVRNSDNLNSLTVGYLDKGDAVLVLEKVGDFYKTIYKEKTAFVHASYCTILEVDKVDEQTEKAIDLGSTLLGYPYVWGSQRYHWGNGKLNANFVNGEFDCSALVQYVYYISNSVILDVTTRTQINNGVHVEKSDLKRGDLMFFTNASRYDKVGVERIGHVGIYFGNNYILHTATDHAVIEPISNTRWSYYISARRVIN